MITELEFFYTWCKRAQEQFIWQKATVKSQVRFGLELSFDAVDAEHATMLINFTNRLTGQEVMYSDCKSGIVNDALLYLVERTAFDAVCELAPVVYWALELLSAAALESAELPITRDQILSARASVRDRTTVGGMAGEALLKRLETYSPWRLKQLHDAGVIMQRDPYAQANYSKPGEFERNAIFEPDVRIKDADFQTLLDLARKPKQLP